MDEGGARWSDRTGAVSLPRYIDRIADAVGPLLGLGGHELARRLDVTVGLRAESDIVPMDGWLLSANLLARLYPRVALDGPEAYIAAARARILAVNPRCEILEAPAGADVRLLWSPHAASPPDVAVWAQSLNIGLDGGLDGEAPAEPLAALAAAALGVGEVFRTVFAAELEARGRASARAEALNLVTLGPPRDLDGSLVNVDFGRAALVGAGAIGQAAVLALGATDARGHVDVVDPERAELSNLQRYVLLDDEHDHVVKATHAAAHMRSAGIAAEALPHAWSAQDAAGGYDMVLVGLDSEADRIGVQTSLPGPIYNAWTQPEDLGWSRHEHFGIEPCLACLYWPRGPRPHQYQTLSAELGQDPLRVLSYLVNAVPVGLPLPHDGIAATPLLPAPPQAAEWTQRSILDDIARAASAPPSRMDRWRTASIADLHRDVICAGALLDLRLTDRQRPVLVPLAHQSALAGVMLVTQALVARHPTLRRERPSAVEARWDMLSSLPQVMPRPRSQAANCLCLDEDFLAAASGATVAP